MITGRVSHEQVADYVNLFDIAVSPKATFYASPMKVVEYMSMGKAVIAPDTNNLSDMIDDGVNGILFEMDSIASLTDCLNKLTESDALRQGIGRNARTKVDIRLNWGWNAHQVVQMVNTVERINVQI